MTVEPVRHIYVKPLPFASKRLGLELSLEKHAILDFSRRQMTGDDVVLQQSSERRYAFFRLFPFEIRHG